MAVSKPEDFSFSAQELAVLKDTHFIQQKIKVTSKCQHFMGHLKTYLLAKLQEKKIDWEQWPWQPTSFHQAKGEDYAGFPYFVLDFPKFYQKEDAFSFRHFLWWGHHYTQSLHLSGKYLAKVRPLLMQNQAFFEQYRCCLSISNDPWKLHLNEEHFRAAHQFSEAAWKSHIAESYFIRIAHFQPIEQKQGHLFPLYADFLSATLALLRDLGEKPKK